MQVTVNVQPRSALEAPESWNRPYDFAALFRISAPQK
jgi:hypothetical protein